MPSQVLTNVEKNFTKGLITEFTGLNFPENAATDTDNCEYTLVGDVLRRLGINYEDNFDTTQFNRQDVAVSYFKWLNAGGDGTSQIFVLQVGNTLHFYKYSDATVTSPMSTTLMPDTVNLQSFLPQGSISTPYTFECEYAEGNGYLFITNPATEPFYLSYIPTIGINATQINIQIRDFVGIQEANVADNVRPAVDTTFHLYNLQNQGWLNTFAWNAASATPNVVNTGPMSFTIPAGLAVIVGARAIAYGNIYYPGTTIIQSQTYVAGNVTSYIGTTLTMNVTVFLTGQGLTATDWTIAPDLSSAQIQTFQVATGLFPSNSDVWWTFKNNSGIYDPATTVNNTSLSTGPAPKGFYIINAFNQNRAALTGLNVPVYNTPKRPSTVAWYAGRAWYTGVNDTQVVAGYYYPYSWTENIYFSQVSINTTQFGRCYQTNDPTSEELFNLLPTDGGVITIQGCGPIYKLFPIQNGLLVFAGNGIWFITGSQGIGFSATDYTITKISSVKTFSATSFVNVLGLPYFWNDEGIYAVTTNQQGGLSVDPITVGTILSFYNEIPTGCRRFARGDYDPVEYVVTWAYRSTDTNSLTDRYSFNRLLNYNTYNKAFYPYSFPEDNPSIQGVSYITGVGGSNAPAAGFKFVASNFTGVTYNFTFAELNDNNYVDWAAVSSSDYESYFITGYKLHGEGQRRFQIPYIYVFSRNEIPTQYKIQGLWDYANTGNSGRWSTSQIARIWSPNFGMVFRRHRIRGQGVVLQIKVKSVSGEPFDIMGWSSFETQNTGV